MTPKRPIGVTPSKDLQQPSSTGYDGKANRLDGPSESYKGSDDVKISMLKSHFKIPPQYVEVPRNVEGNPLTLSIAAVASRLFNLPL